MTLDPYMGGFLSHRATPKSSILDWDFHEIKPFSYWGTPMALETSIDL